MKSLILTSSLLVSSAAFATDWPTLIKLAPTLKKETVTLDSKGLITADAVKLPSGKYRFLNFTSYVPSKRPTVILPGDEKTNLGELCRNSVMFDKKFKAKLIVQTNPMSTNSKPLFGINLNSFENPVKIGIAKFSFDRKNSIWTNYDYEALANSKGRHVTDYYTDLMNSQLQKSPDGVLRMDLTSMNAFACDLILGNFTFSAKSVAEYEQGLPAKEIWVGLEQFTSIFQSFWKVQPQIVDARLAQSQNELAEAVALGIVTRRVDINEEILKSPNRMQKFLASIKSDTRSMTPVQKTAARPAEILMNWELNSEYMKPTTETVSQQLTVGGDIVSLMFED